jgi:hypothetical protein
MNELVDLKGTIHSLGKHADGSVFVDKQINNTVVSGGKTKDGLLSSDYLQTVPHYSAYIRLPLYGQMSNVISLTTELQEVKAS